MMGVWMMRPWFLMCMIISLGSPVLPVSVDFPVK